MLQDLSDVQRTETHVLYGAHPRACCQPHDDETQIKAERTERKKETELTLTETKFLDLAFLFAPTVKLLIQAWSHIHM